MSPGRSPGRLRSKTADFSDLLRGSPSKLGMDVPVPPVPAVPPLPDAVTPKTKRKLTGFLGLRRKSAGIALSHEPSVPVSEDGASTAGETSPAIPDAILSSRIPAPSQSRASSSLPSSLPPLNVSPTSFATHFPPTSSSPVKSRFTGSHQLDADNAGNGNPRSSRTLRTQKSVSFEVSRPSNSAHNAVVPPVPALGDKAKKPVITISAPPGPADEADVDLYKDPRTAPTPPSTSSSSKSSSGQGHSRRALGFGFGHHKKDDAKEKERIISHPITEAPLIPVQNRFAASAGEKPSPTPSLSPILPASMRFPVPPKRGAGPGGVDQNAAREDDALTSAFQSSSPSSLSSTLSPHTATPSDLADRSPTPKPTRTPPSRPPRPTSLILPSTSRRTPPSKGPDSPASSSGKQSLRARSRRTSRSPSPASPPPKAPLPSPPTSATFPSSDTEGWTTDASTTIGGWTTDASSRIGSVGTIPSLASRRSVASAARLRANTIAVVRDNKGAHSGAGAMSSGDEIDRAKSRHCIPGVLSARHAPKERTRADTIVPSAQGRASDTGETTPTRDDGSGQSLRAAHDTFVRMLREKHAMEKAELLKRIERLEKEARRREREIKGLRWLVMNGGADRGGSAVLSVEDQIVMGRLRSGSKASDFSAASSGRSRSSSLLHTAPDPESEEPAESVEEGLRDLQATVGDLISANFPPTAEGRGRPDSPPEDAMGSLSRSHTFSDSPGSASSAVKQLRRSSSPVLSGGISSKSSGLGFDIPSIPGSGSDMSLTTAESVSLPSLTATNTASSSLSVIPEVTSSVIEHDGERALKEERRASRMLKRISASSPAQASYATNLKIGMSPSIEQVLDRVDGGMDDVLKKLRAFGGSA
ncbi:hypothetical protein EIP86_010905 [Pleurotus ostreatoroseus]|nr:hypothetical protein EIP86_010905 [Pleurotus ostreatoroseus]